MKNVYHTSFHNILCIITFSRPSKPFNKLGYSSQSFIEIFGDI